VVDMRDDRDVADLHGFRKLTGTPFSAAVVILVTTAGRFSAVGLRPTAENGISLLHEQMRACRMRLGSG
jgi:hypothetical protein